MDRNARRDIPTDTTIPTALSLENAPRHGPLSLPLNGSHLPSAPASARQVRSSLRLRFDRVAFSVAYSLPRVTESQRAIAGLEGSRKMCLKRAKIPAATDTVDIIDSRPSLIRNKLFAYNTARRIRLTGPSANFIELAAHLLLSLAFTRQLLPHLRGFSICAVRFRAAPVQKGA